MKNKSRNLKFRVWSEDQKTYDYKFLYNSIGDFYVNTRGEVFSDFGNSVAPEVRQENFIVEQYAGIRDKNNKEIYEGDVVSYKTRFEMKVLGETKEKIVEIKGVVCFEHGSFVIKYGSQSQTFRDFFDDPEVFNVPYDLEVLGNIHENPELL